MSKKFRRRQQLEEIGNCFYLEQRFSTNISLVSFSRTVIPQLEMSVCMPVLANFGGNVIF